jgi:hypothetical protein
MARSGLAVGAPKKTTKVPAPPMRASFIPGSRPPDLRAPAIQRIKPMTGQTQYGKLDGNIAGANSGNTGQTSWS